MHQHSILLSIGVFIFVIVLPSFISMVRGRSNFPAFNAVLLASGTALICYALASSP